MPKRSRTPSPTPSTPESSTFPPQHLRRLSTPPPATTVITCDIPPLCNAVPFPSYEAYESHYNSVHTNRCSECHHNFPSTRYLEVHIRECHDELAQLRRERGEKIYECYVDGCDKVCLTRAKRKMHLIDKHGFPKDFYWAVIDKGVDKRKTLLNGPQIEANTGLPVNVKSTGTHLKPPSSARQSPPPADEMDSISGMLGSLKLVPRSVQLKKQ